MTLTAQDAGDLLNITYRVDIKGNEATVVAILQQKLTALLETPEIEEAAKKTKTPKDS